DENALAADPGLLVHADQLAGLGQRSLGVKAEAGIDLGRDAAGHDLENLATEGDKEFVDERYAAGGRVARGAEGKVQRLIDQVLVVRLLGGLEDQRRVGRRILRLV